MGEIKNIISQAKSFAGRAIDFVKGIPGKIAELPLVKEIMAHPVRYACIAGGVILLIILLKTFIKASVNRNPHYVNIRANGRAERRAMRRAERREDRYYRALIRERRREKYYLPRKRRVIYVKTKAPKTVQKPVQTVQQVYGPVDQAAMLATGIFGVGVGMMAQTAIENEKKKLMF